VSFRTLRISLLLVVLSAVALGAWQSRARSTAWDSTLWIAIYPLSADASEVSDGFIAQLTPETFAPVRTFFEREAERHGVALREPVRVDLYDRVDDLPPAYDAGANVLSRMLWSLRLRWWAWDAGDQEGRVPPDIRVFVLFHDPAITQRVPHSLGLQKGLLGVVHAFADRDMIGQNNIVIAHELMHTLGATDKYDAQSGQPVFPDGYGDPGQDPLHPQAQAEVMAGRRALSASEWEMPASLRSVVVGSLTAAEINWADRP
jgi:hypothetical protein